MFSAYSPTWTYQGSKNQNGRQNRKWTYLGTHGENGETSVALMQSWVKLLSHNDELGFIAVAHMGFDKFITSYGIILITSTQSNQM